MKDRINKPAIRFKGFDEAWEQRKFSDITYLAGEKNRDNIAYQSYSISNEKGFIPQNEQFENGGTMREADKSMYLIVQPNSFAYNPARINVGSIGYYDLPENVIVSSLYEVFKTSDDIDDRFLWHWFKSDLFPKFIERYQEGGVRMYFYYNKLCMCFLDLPSIEEQRKIGEYFDKLDNLITLHQRKLDKLKKIKKSMLEKMFPKNGEKRPEVRFEGFNDDWEQREFSSLANLRRGLIYKPTDVRDKGVIVLRSSNINEDKFVLNEDDVFVYEKSVNIDFIKENDILITSANGSSHLVGKHALVDKMPIKAVHGGFMLAASANNPFFVNSLMSSSWYSNFIKINILGGNGAIGNLRKNDLDEQIVLVPNELEQEKIGSFFRSLDKLITLHQRKLEKLENIKKAMLEKMFV